MGLFLFNKKVKHFKNTNIFKFSLLTQFQQVITTLQFPNISLGNLFYICIKYKPIMLIQHYSFPTITPKNNKKMISNDKCVFYVNR